MRWADLGQSRSILALWLLSGVVAAAQEPAPRAILLETSYDFGTVMPGTTVRHSFTLRNAGNVDLLIEGMQFSLPGLTIQGAGVIAPGTDGTVSLELTTEALRGDVQGDVILRTNDSQSGPLRLHLHGIVRSLVEVTPGAVLLRAFRWEAETIPGVVTIANQGEGPLVILGSRTDSEGERFTARVSAIEAGQRYQLTVNLNASSPAGRAQGRVIVQTNKGEIAVPVLTFLKERVYVSPPDIDLGRISLEQLAREPNLLNFRTQAVFVYKYRGQNFQITPESSLPFLALEKTPPVGTGALVDIPQQGPTAVFEVRVAPMRDQLKPGKFEGVIRVTTNDPEFPELTIPVRGEIE
jgi:hypothetical protein